MVRLVPKYNEIFVSSLHRQEIVMKLELVTQNIKYSDLENFRINRDCYFIGSVGINGFKLSLRVDKPDSFLPLVKGTIEPTAKGSIIFLHYSFFPSTEFFLGFWSVLSFLLTVFFLSVNQDWVFAALSALVGIGNYTFAFFNFKRKVKQSQKVFIEMMDLGI